MLRNFKTDSNDNTLFITSQCNNNCLMCCQPPTKSDNSNALLQENLKIIQKAPTDISYIGITGGEPTLAFESLLTILDAIREKYPTTLIHFLTNGRLFSEEEYIKRLQKYNLSNILFAIPLHSDYSKDHDYIAQSSGAYNETMTGLYNLANYDANIELRIIINKINYTRLEQISDFIAYNLPFVENTAFIGMEAIGFAVKNASEIWIFPEDYQEQLSQAVLKLSRWNLPCSIFNIPFCLLPEELYSFAEQSISNWKTFYLNKCKRCKMKTQCCGLFSTSIWQSNAIHPVL